MGVEFSNRSEGLDRHATLGRELPRGCLAREESLRSGLAPGGTSGMCTAGLQWLLLLPRLQRALADVPAGSLLPP